MALRSMPRAQSDDFLAGARSYGQPRDQTDGGEVPPATGSPSRRATAAVLEWTGSNGCTAARERAPSTRTRPPSARPPPACCRDGPWWQRRAQPADRDTRPITKAPISLALFRGLAVGAAAAGAIPLGYAAACRCRRRSGTHPVLAGLAGWVIGSLLTGLLIAGSAAVLNHLGLTRRGWCSCSATCRYGCSRGSLSGQR